MGIYRKGHPGTSQPDERASRKPIRRLPPGRREAALETPASVEIALFPLPMKTRTPKIGASKRKAETVIRDIEFPTAAWDWLDSIGRLAGVSGETVLMVKLATIANRKGVAA